MRRSSSFALDLDAAEYFKLKLSQVEQLSGIQLPQNIEAALKQNQEQKEELSSVNMAHQKASCDVRAERNSKNFGEIFHQRQHHNRNQTNSTKPSETKSEASKKCAIVKRREQSERKVLGMDLSSRKRADEGLIGRRKVESKKQNKLRDSIPPIGCDHEVQFISRQSSSSSLPSISSSPSLSPSLVCPHLSLDDLLNLRNGSLSRNSSSSPHTIGMCPKCRLTPPANVHSPLSPTFKPSRRNYSQNQLPELISSSQLIPETDPQWLKSNSSLNSASYSGTRFKRPGGSLKRGYSDHHEQVVARSRHQVAGGTRVKALKGLDGGPRDDSLDYYLEPNELRRMQLSPALRHSVEFIRNHSMEAARVLRVYKNGFPYDKPLRVSITRGEFHSLNHLLDYISSRQLICFGARYMFHLDGQLVYSVNELKHDSAYIVSGVRQLETQAAQLIKQQEIMSRARSNSVGRQRRRVSSIDLPQPSMQEGLKVAIEREALGSNIEPQTPSGAQPKQPSKSNQIITRRKSSLDGPREKIRQPTIVQEVTIKKNENVTRLTNKKQDSKQERAATTKPLRALPPVIKKQSIQSMESSRSVEVKKSPPKSLVRAKSELNGLQSRRKKNVTFVDTGRGSSPAISELGKQSDELRLAGKSKASSMESLRETSQMFDNPDSSRSYNEIGIQVSDSIDGFLIDLPIPLPPKGDEAKLVARGGRKFGRFNGKYSKVASSGYGSKAGAIKRPTKIVTLTERQLSTEEIDKFKDLDHGNHYKGVKEPVLIKLDHCSDRELSDDDQAGSDKSKRKSKNADDDEQEAPVVDLEEQVAIGGKEQAKVVAEAVKKAPAKEHQQDGWQYPSGREQSATPDERPVSQNEPNETVQARVTTPTPSLSTMADSSSLTISYESSHSPEVEPVKKKTSGEANATSSGSSPPVQAHLCNGLDEPPNPFKLTWINGFTINDLYPENSSIYSSTDSASNSAATAATSPSGQVGRERLLSPSPKRQVASQFKPSSRFANWIKYSKLQEQLVYPVGRFVVLWCRRSGQQRYYSNHESNVTALCLSSSISDLAASAQQCEPSESIAGSVHIWSLSSLETLAIVEDDLFKGRKLFSLSLKEINGIQSKQDVANTNRERKCQLTVAALEEKRLWLYSSQVTLAVKQEEDAKRKQVTNVMSTSKLLQTNQFPLLMIQISEIETSQPCNIILSFGRRHFQVYLFEKGKRSIQVIPAEDKTNTKFSSLISSANCMTIWSKNELLVGDSSGSISLVLLSWQDLRAKPGTARESIATSIGSKAVKNPQQRYSIEQVITLSCSQEPESDHVGQKTSTSITTITKLSNDLFVSSDSQSTIHFWKLDKKSTAITSTKDEDENTSSDGTISNSYTCQEITSINLPSDLVFLCSILQAKYNAKKSLVELYLISTSNAILFGSIQLKAGNQLANSSLSVVYEGHETSVMSLVADLGPVSNSPSKMKPKKGSDQSHDLISSANRCFFTCSLDFKICKWSGKNLTWKSLLPSACASLAVHPTGFVLAVGSLDGTIYIMDKISGLLISYFPLTPVCINCLAYSRDGSLLAAGCANGSIFILPVYDNGLKYKKVSIFQSPYPVVSVQFSMDNRYILTSVTHGLYQELILWDLPNFRFMRDNVIMAADEIQWYDSICSGSEDVRAIWDNANIVNSAISGGSASKLSKLTGGLVRLGQSQADRKSTQVINLSCHRLIGFNETLNDEQRDTTNGQGMSDLAIASDTRGYLRLFRYPCYDARQGFYEIRVGSAPVNTCRFLHSNEDRGKDSVEKQAVHFASTSADGAICLWSTSE